jgi:NADPH:quinone reductase-like Zn-dependent oxidoreductase
MKAIICPRYGSPDVLRLEEVPKPVPKDDQVLVRNHAATVTMGDCEVRSFKMKSWIWLFARLGFGLRGPRMKVLGMELAGEIESVGKDVKRFSEGDRVFAGTAFHLSAHAEYTCLPEDGLIAPKPDNLSYDEVVSLPIGGLNALHFIRKAGIGRGQKVLINGAGGSIGTYAVQLAKSAGAEVAAVDSAGKLDMLRSIGADEVIDYAEGDFTKNGQPYDVIFDVVGKSSYSRSLKSLEKSGFYLLANPGLIHMIRGAWVSRTTGKKVVFGSVTEKTEDLVNLGKMMEEGMIKAIIDRSYPLEKTADAHRYVESGEKRGHVVLTMGS